MAKRQPGRAGQTVVGFDLPVKTFSSQRAWEAWLDQHPRARRIAQYVAMLAAGTSPTERRP